MKVARIGSHINARTHAPWRAPGGDGTCGLADPLRTGDKRGRPRCAMRCHQRELPLNPRPGFCLQDLLQRPDTRGWGSTVDVLLRSVRGIADGRGRASRDGRSVLRLSAPARWAGGGTR